jgi:hypothetical protein
VTPKTVTSYVNGTNTINNSSSEALTVDIASNGNIIFGWEDDGDGITDTESMWTLVDPIGNLDYSADSGVKPQHVGSSWDARDGHNLFLVILPL